MRRWSAGCDSDDNVDDEEWEEETKERIEVIKNETHKKRWTREKRKYYVIRRKGLVHVARQSTSLHVRNIVQRIRIRISIMLRCWFTLKWRAETIWLTVGSTLFHMQTGDVCCVVRNRLQNRWSKRRRDERKRKKGTLFYYVCSKVRVLCVTLWLDDFVIVCYIIYSIVSVPETKKKIM